MTLDAPSGTAGPFDPGSLIEAREMRELVDAGFLAASRNLVPAAVDIFQAVIAARPNLTAGYVGLAYTMLGAGRPDQALEALRDAPYGFDADLFRGMALLNTGETAKGRKILEHVAKFSDQESFASVAKTLLAEQPTA